ncbi:hypothetical protein GJ496_002874 [Pomphorhynchus laevis]|nr:hypothetical protein GJ496_002874 [Pomphorhynchus laevis]
MGACIGCRKRKLKSVDAESKLDLLEFKRNRDNYFHDPKNVEISTFADISPSNCSDSSLRNNTITNDENCLLLRSDKTVISNIISQLQGSTVTGELKVHDENDRTTHVESKLLEACHLNNHEDDDESGYYEGNGDSPQRACVGGITSFEDDENYDENCGTIAADCCHFTTSSLLFDRNLSQEECITKKMSLRGTNSRCQDYLNRLLPSDFLLPVMVFDKQKVKYNQFELTDFYQMLLVSSGRSSIPNSTSNENKLIWKSTTCKFDRFSISMKDNRQSFWFRDSSSTVVSALVLHQQFIDFIIAKFTLEIVNNLLTSNSHLEDVNHIIKLPMNTTIKFIRPDYNVKPSLLAVYQMHNEACENIQLVTVNYTNIKRIHTTSISFIVPLDEWPKGYCDEFFQRQRKWPNTYDINRLRIQCAAVQPTHQNRWIFYFGLCENLLVSVMSKTHKSFFQYVMATFTNQSPSAIVIDKVKIFPAVILTHMLLRYFEHSDNICYQQFVPWFRQLFERSALLHYFDSSTNFQQESSLEQWIDIKQRIGYLYNRKNTSLQTRIIGNTVLTSELKFKLMYIAEFSLELKRRIVSGNLIRIDPRVIESINDELQRKGNFLACRKKIHEDIFFNEIEHSANIVQAYINQIRAEYVPILYHCLWSSYIHYAYPFILQVIEKPIF